MSPSRPAMHRAFTLVELLVTVAIVVVLTAIAVPVGRFAVAKSRASACLAKLRGIGVAIESHLQDHNNLMPDLEAGRRSRDEDVPVLETGFATYLPDREAFHCPADDSEFARSGSSYLWNNTQSGRHKLKLAFFGATGEPRSVPLVTDKEAWHPGGSGVNILYADYHISDRIEFRATP